MTPLTESEKAHVDTFAATRKDWSLAVLSQRMHDENDNTRGHKYARAHPYVTGMHFVMHYLRGKTPCKVLDIGSPIAQNVALGCLPGVDVTVLDVRPNEDAGDLGLKWELASATALPYADASWDIVTSLWVMGHVGDGRYGDPLVVDGDLAMLKEISRVLRPSGTAIIGPGLVSDTCGNIFNCHRIYSWPWLRAAFNDAGFDMIQSTNLFVSDDIFLDIKEAGLDVQRRDGNYGLAILRKR